MHQGALCVLAAFTHSFTPNAPWRPVCCQVAIIALVPEPFTVENNLLTPTFKLKRPQAKEAFGDLITAMYAQLPADSPATPNSDIL